MIAGILKMFSMLTGLTLGGEKSTFKRKGEIQQDRMAACGPPAASLKAAPDPQGSSTCNAELGKQISSLPVYPSFLTGRCGGGRGGRQTCMALLPFTL